MILDSFHCHIFQWELIVGYSRVPADAYADIFSKGLKKTKVGITDIPEYSAEKASEEELKSQNSYFINEILKHGENATDENSTN